MTPSIYVLSIDIFTSALGNLSTLLEKNNCCVSKDDLEGLVALIKAFDPNNSAILEWVNFNARANLSLLANSSLGQLGVENSVAELEDDTPY